MEVAGGVDSQGVGDRRGDVPGTKLFADRIAGVAVRFSDDRSGGDASSSEDDRVGRCPVLAAGRCSVETRFQCNQWRPTEFAHADDERFVEQTSRVEIFENAEKL